MMIHESRVLWPIHLNNRVTDYSPITRIQLKNLQTQKNKSIY